MISTEQELEKIREKILNDMQCPLKDAATNLVFGKGNPHAKIIFIGEAPGAQEDLQGIPFVGAAGKELDRLLRLINLSLDDVYIANILKYRPPNNRNPSSEEIRRHTPYLIEQIAAIQPRIIATLGNFATKFVLARFDSESMQKIGGITHLHGKAQEITVSSTTPQGSPAEFSFTVFPLYHPAATLYNRKLMPELEADFRAMQKLLETP